MPLTVSVVDLLLLYKSDELMVAVLQDLTVIVPFEPVPFFSDRSDPERV